MINNDLSSWFNSPYLSASQNVFDTKETANRNSAKMSEKHKKKDGRGKFNGVGTAKKIQTFKATVQAYCCTINFARA